jgi:hypothetical protein
MVAVAIYANLFRTVQSITRESDLLAFRARRTLANQNVCSTPTARFYLLENSFRDQIMDGRCETREFETETNLAH